MVKGEQIAVDNGVPPDGRRILIGLDMRYGGQAFELTVWCEPEVATGKQLRVLFEAEHESRYGYSRALLPVELVSYRIRIMRDVGGTMHTPLPSGVPNKPEHFLIALAGRRYNAISITRDSLACGQVLEGPAVLVEPTSTTFVPPGWRVECLASGDLLLQNTG
jgi:N-methylhydantoinase A